MGHAIVRDEKGDIRLPNPGMSWTWLASLLGAMIAPLIPILSSEIRNGLKTLLETLYAKAKESANPWDDWLLELMFRILGFEVPAR